MDSSVASVRWTAESATRASEDASGPELRWPTNTSGAKSGACRGPTVKVLPDNVLLEIFDFDRLSSTDRSWEHPWQWHRLVHVCQRWRRVVFSSPRRLDLRLFCSMEPPSKRLWDFGRHCLSSCVTEDFSGPKPFKFS
ncbi:hypothetical protein EI94DRAFT_198508 [Lactarius quietus]|nr:hypothetical protein EI94DRAFT_198508 [Lactarius quietus]